MPAIQFKKQNGYLKITINGSEILKEKSINIHEKMYKGIHGQTRVKKEKGPPKKSVNSIGGYRVYTM